MATKKKRIKKPSRAATLAFAVDELERRLVALAHRATELTAALGQERVAWVTIEGRQIEFDFGDKVGHARGIPRVKRVGWTQLALMPFDDSRPVVRFEPFKKMLIECVRVHGAGVIEAVRVGREEVSQPDHRGQAVAELRTVCELGSHITVQLGPVPRVLR